MKPVLSFVRVSEPFIGLELVTQLKMQLTQLHYNENTKVHTPSG